VTFGPHEPAHLVEAVRAALALYADRPRFRRMQRLGMKAEFSWTEAAAQYEAMYCDALGRREASSAPMEAVA
jgi:starch synthase